VPPDVDPVQPPNTSTPDPGRDTPSGTGSDVPPASGDNSNLLFGNPSNATANVVMSENYLIDLKYYIESYSKSRGTPNWLSWHLDETSIGSTGRLDNFGAYIGLPTGFYQVQSNSYSGSGFDRGHNCPSADRTSSTEANSSTFLMVNIIPQAPNNNQRGWATLENYLRSEVQKGNEVYIVMGNYGKGGLGSNGSAETINNGNVTVPKRVWKIAVILPKGNGDLARVNENTRILAVDTPNENTMDSDWTKYITTVDAIEKATGYNLLSNLPVALQQTLQLKLFKP
jgi:endonuclease G